MFKQNKHFHSIYLYCILQREKKGKRNREQYQNKKSNKEKEIKRDVKVHHEEDLNDEEDHVEDLHVEEDEDFEENGAPITPRLGGFYQHDCSYKDPLVFCVLLKFVHFVIHTGQLVLNFTLVVFDKLIGFLFCINYNLLLIQRSFLV